MITILTVAALLAAQSTPSPAEAQPSVSTPSAASLSEENRAIVRCSAAFALISHGQANGNEAAQKWPALGERGKEFFVRALAGIMDDAGLNRDGVSQLVSAEAQRLWDAGEVEQVMPACLLMLEASGL